MEKIQLPELTHTGIKVFQTVFTEAYSQFAKDRQKLIVKQFRESESDIKEGYYHARKVLAILNANEFLKVIRRKPEKLPRKLWEKAGSFDKSSDYCNAEVRLRKENSQYEFDTRYSEEVPEDAEFNKWVGEYKHYKRASLYYRVQTPDVHSYLEVFPTGKGFKAFADGDFCPIKPVSIYLGEGEHKMSTDKIGIGKPYLGYQYLLNKYFIGKRGEYNICETRWFGQWLRGFDVLFTSKLCFMTVDEAVPEIEALIAELKAKLPAGRRSSKKLTLQKTAKLESFITSRP